MNEAMWIIAALALAGQTGAGTVTQLPAAPANPTGAAQVAPTRSHGSEAGSASQVSRGEPPLGPSNQVSTPAAGRVAGPVRTTAPTAEAPPLLSSPAEGRRADAETISGHDRCDPAAGTSAARQCRQVIENRAAEFKRAEPAPLTPEQRLLVKETVQQPGTAARRLATNAGDPDNLQEQSIVTALSRQNDKGRMPESAPGNEEAARLFSIINMPAPPK